MRCKRCREIFRVNSSAPEPTTNQDPNDASQQTTESLSEPIPFAILVADLVDETADERVMPEHQSLDQKKRSGGPTIPIEKNRPRPVMKGKASSGRALLVTLVIGIVLFLGGSVGLTILYFSHRPQLAPTTFAQNQAPPIIEMPDRIDPVPGNPKPVKPEPAKPEPPKPEPSKLEPEQLKPIVPVIPPRLASNKMSVTLPAPADDAVVGGNGRYIVLHLPSQRQLVMFDVSEARIVRSIPVNQDLVRFAAGQEKLVVWLPDANLLQRWNLETGEREIEVQVEETNKMGSIALGAASRGPVFLCGEFLDLRTLKPLPLRREGTDWNAKLPRSYVRASTDGKVFGAWRSGTQGIQTYVLQGQTFRAYYQNNAAGHVIPSPDGEKIYTARGIFPSRIPESTRPGLVDYCLPAVHGNYYLKVSKLDPVGVSPNQRLSLAIHQSDNGRLLTTPTDLDLPQDFDPWDVNPFSLDRRILFIPQAKVLVTIPESNDRLVLHRLDIEQVVARADRDALQVTSQPPTLAVKGRSLIYQMIVASNKGGVKYRLDVGPPGMTVSDKGELVWHVPDDTKDSELFVSVKVSDDSGGELLHIFKVQIVSNAPANPIAQVPTKPPSKDLDPRPLLTNDPAPSQPLSVPVPLQPPVLDSDVVTRPLTASVADVVVGGGGRYLVLYLPSERRLAIFDVSTAKVARFIATEDDSVYFAAGRDKLVVALAMLESSSAGTCTLANKS